MNTKTLTVGLILLQTTKKKNPVLSYSDEVHVEEGKAYWNTD